NLSVHELRRAVIAAFGPTSGASERMAVRVLSFGFKYGTPVDADLVFDVRFLKNPYFVPDLKRLPGTDERVRKYVLALPETGEFLDRTLALLKYVVPKYEKEGKSYLTIAFGCTGGMHRSVVLAEEVAAALDSLLTERASRPDINADEKPIAKIDINVSHRDVERKTASPRTRPVGSVPPGAGGGL
ncbi:MAG TPA: RNase adapter RapZ, partial [Labilithrix sp.]